MSDKENLRKALQDINFKLENLNTSFVDNFFYLNPAKKLIQRLIGLLSLNQFDGSLFDSQYKSLVSKLNSLIEKEHLDKDWSIFISSMNDLEQKIVNSFIQGRRGFMKKSLAVATGIGILGSKAFSQTTPINAQELYKELQKIPELKPTQELVAARSHYNSIIIIVQDRHHSPRVEEKQLRILKEKFGINFIGTENWAGSEADREKGFEMNDSEIKSLLGDNNFTIVGIEDRDLLELSTRFIGLRLHFIWVESIKEAKTNEQRKMYCGPRDSAFIQAGVEPTGENIERIIREFESRFNINLHTTKEKAEEELESIHQRLLVDSRNKAMAMNMFRAMKKNNIHAGVIVVGAAHAEGLIIELRRLHDFNIIVVP